MTTPANIANPPKGASTEAPPEANHQKPQTFAEYYASRGSEAVGDLQEFAAFFRLELAAACEDTPADAPLAQAGGQALELLKHMEVLLAEEQRRKGGGYSSAGALGELFNKALFPKRREPIPVLELLSEPLTKVDDKLKRHEDPFDPATCERQRIAMMLLLYMVQARCGGYVPEHLAKLLAPLDNGPTGGEDWWKVGREILRENAAALQKLGLEIYKTAKFKRPDAPDVEFRSQLKKHFLSAYASYQGDPVLKAGTGISIRA